MTAPTDTTARLTHHVREAMAQVSAAVAVVTIRVDGEPHGTTVSAFTLVSMDPLLFGICLDNRSELLSKVRPGAVVGVNVLDADQADVAAQYARKDTGVLNGVHRLTDSEPPALSQAHAVIAFTATQFVPVGDHTLVIGGVTAADLTPGAPLVYWQRTYGTHTAAPQ